jgi:spore germination cell wall hydrolase CwlJ-like protein
LLTGSIEFEDPYDIFEERFIVGAKRGAIALAVIALAISGHDLLSSRPLGSTTAYAHGNENLQLAKAKPAEIAVTASATVSVPEKKKTVVAPIAAKSVAAKAKTSPVAAKRIAEKTKISPLAELAEARHLNALEVAMAFDPVMAKAIVTDLTSPAPVNAGTKAEAKVEAKPEPVQVASIDPQSLPRVIKTPATEIAVSLPAAISVLPRPAPRARAVPPMKTISVVVPAAKAEANTVTVASIAPEASAVGPAKAPSSEIHITLPAMIAVLPRPALRAKVTAATKPVASAEQAQAKASLADIAAASAMTEVAAVVRMAAEKSAQKADGGMMQLASIDPESLAYGPSASAAPEIHISLPATISVLPPSAPGAPPPSPAQRLHLEGAKRAKAEHCLANAIYFEARDQPYQGQVAVAQVVINRVFSGVYPRDVCGVVYQNANRHLACQFTFACDGKRDVVNEWPEWRRAKRIAQEALDGVVYVQAVGTATHYHANYVHPNWVGEMHRLAREGEHLFYRPIAWGNGSDEPIWSRAQKAFLKLTKKH